MKMALKLDAVLTYDHKARPSSSMSSIPEKTFKITTTYYIKTGSALIQVGNNDMCHSSESCVRLTGSGCSH